MIDCRYLRFIKLSEHAELLLKCIYLPINRVKLLNNIFEYA